ncbi:unnamed protein product, partial [Porites lobata]
ISKDLAELKSSLQFTQKDDEDLKPVTKQMTKIGKELKEVEIERAHRTGKVNRRSDDNASSTRPRTVICRLVSWKQKDPILKAARILKPEGMFVTEDLALSY